jgi:DnaJ like chaperone protein
MNFLKSPNAALILALVYFVFPLDLIPDIFGPFGRFDDLLIFGLAIWRVLKDRQARSQEQQGTNQSSQRNEPEGSTKNVDPYTLFKLQPGASQAEIDARYKELAKDYHPDRVAHLGEDLRTVAHEKMIEIQRAYEQLTNQTARR